MRAVGIADAVTTAFLRVLAKEVHVSKARVRRLAFISFTVNPVIGRVFAVEAAPAHVRLLIEQIAAPISTPIKNGKL